MKTEVVLFEKENFANLVAGIEFIPTFAVLQDDDRIRYAGQAVNLLNSVIGLFLCPKVKYWRLPIRKIHICSRSEYNHLVAAYMATAFFIAISKPF